MFKRKELADLERDLKFLDVSTLVRDLLILPIID